MVNVRHGIAQIGYVLLAVWVVFWIIAILRGEFFGKPDWSRWPLVSTVLIGYPLGVFLLWRMLLWLIKTFIRPTR